MDDSNAGLTTGGWFWLNPDNTVSFAPIDEVAKSFSTDTEWEWQVVDYDEFMELVHGQNTDRASTQSCR